MGRWSDSSISNQCVSVAAMRRIVLRCVAQSGLEHCVWDAGVEGSNPSTPTIQQPFWTPRDAVVSSVPAACAARWKGTSPEVLSRAPFDFWLRSAVFHAAQARFESGTGYHSIFFMYRWRNWQRSGLQNQRLRVRVLLGTPHFFTSIAQLVERCVERAGVLGSIPS